MSLRNYSYNDFKKAIEDVVAARQPGCDFEVAVIESKHHLDTFDVVMRKKGVLINASSYVHFQFVRGSSLKRYVIIGIGTRKLPPTENAFKKAIAIIDDRIRDTKTYLELQAKHVAG